jgi:putative hemolysin
VEQPEAGLWCASQVAANVQIKAPNVAVPCEELVTRLSPILHAHAMNRSRPFSTICGMNTLHETNTLARDSVVAQAPVANRIETSKAAAHGIEVSWAKHQDEVRAAQKLRFDVFAGEMGARLNTPIAGHDVDLFDNYCEHLLVRDQATQQVIGTYRVLTPVQAKRVGSTYSDTEFD